VKGDGDILADGEMAVSRERTKKQKVGWQG
jgi:hypothetical protein